MSAPPAPAYTGPAFLFEGDTFAVPSWEFRCDLPPGAPPGLPSTMAATTLFDVTWAVFRLMRNGHVGVLFLAPSGEGLALDATADSVAVTKPRRTVGGAAVPRSPMILRRTPDEFMHALRAIAERNSE